jgi:TPR repeat protein
MNASGRDAPACLLPNTPRCVTGPVAKTAWRTSAKRLISALGMLLAPVGAHAGLAEGDAAFQRGDYAIAATEWTPLARAGRKEAEYGLGFLYYHGLGVEKDYRVAFLWLNRAARSGHPLAQYLFGMLHLRGYGTERDPQVAAVWLTKAANAGVILGIYELGRLHEAGFLGKRDLHKATSWFELSAQADHAPSQIALARVLTNVRNDRHDIEAAHRWVARAAELGDPDGQKQVADRYLLERAYAKALDLYLESAGQGHSGAEATLGRMYLQGDGVAVDYKTAFDWLCKAAAQGESSAFSNLGTIFQDGLGQRRDIALGTALRWVARERENPYGYTPIQQAPASFTDRDVAAVSELATALGRLASFRSALDAYLRKPPLAVTPAGKRNMEYRLIERSRP